MRTTLYLILFTFLLGYNAFSQSAAAVQKWVDKGDWASISNKAAKASMASIVVSVTEVKNETSVTTAYSLLEYTILKKQDDITKKLLISGDPNAKANEDNNPLLLAILIGNTEIIQLLIAKGADINEQGHEGWTPITLAAHSGDMSLMQVLLQKGAHIDDHNIHGETPLLIAAKLGYLDIVRLLLQQKAEIKTKDRNGNSALILAAIGGHRSVVELLLEEGANYTHTNTAGETATTIVTKLGHLEVLQALINKGLTNNMLTTAAMIAIQNNQMDCLKLFIKNGLNLDPYSENCVLISLIEEAIKTKDSTIVNLVLEHTANKNDFLILTSRKSKVNLVEMLLKRGAEVNSKDKDGLAAVLVAAQAGSVPTVRLLLKYGADPNAKTPDNKYLRDIFNDKKIYLELDANPRFPGCEKEGTDDAAKTACAEKKLLEFVQKNLQYPESAKAVNASGMAAVSFAVAEDGSLTNIEITKDPGGGLGKEAARVVELMNKMPEKWIPAMQLGRPVKVRYSLPFNFKGE